MNLFINTIVPEDVIMSESLIKKTTGFALVGVLIIILAGSVPSAGQASGGSDPNVVDVNHKQTIDPDESFEAEVKTSSSVGTVVLVESQDFKTNVSSSKGFVNGNRVEFIDPSESNSTYTVTITVIGSEEGDSGNIVAWVGAEKRASAVDEQVSSFQIDQSRDNDNEFDQNSGDGSSDKSNSSNQTNVHNDSDNTNETRKLTESDDTGQDETVDTADSENASSTSVNNSNHSENSSMTSVDDSVPGFGTILAIASYFIAGYLMSRKRN